MADSNSPFSTAIPSADYYDAKPEFHVCSWSPAEPGTRDAPATQVHVRIGTPPGFCALVRIKSAVALDQVIASLIDRTFVWGTPTDHRVWLPAAEPKRGGG